MQPFVQNDNKIDPIECESELTESEDDDDTPTSPRAVLEKDDKPSGQRTSNVDVPDILRSPPNLKHNLRNILNRIQTIGNFGFSTTNEAPYNPGLHSPNFGMIRLPISVEESRALIESSRRRINGKKETRHRKMHMATRSFLTSQRARFGSSIPLSLLKNPYLAEMY